MLIGIDASRANRSHKSGTEWYSYYMIRALAAVDSHNHYILYSDTPLTGGLADLRANRENTATTQKQTAIQHVLPSPHNNFEARILRSPFKFFWTQARLSWEMIRRRPDILFVPAHALPIIHPRNSVVTIHDIGFRSDPTLYGRERLGAENRRRHRFLNFLIRLCTLGRYGANTFDYLEWSTRFSLKHARRIIAISNFTKQELLTTYQTPADKIIVIHNGYAHNLYHSIPDTDASQAIINRYGISQPYIFYVGRLEKKKNIATLIEAFAQLKQQRGTDFYHKLCLIGDAGFGFDEIKYTIQEYNLANDVIMTGWVAEEDLPHIFARADAFVFPSNYEGFGIPLLQAMATETPIVASKVASIPEVVGEAGLLCDPKNPQDLANALAMVLYNTAVREKLISNSKERISQFSWEKAARELILVFTSFTQRHRQ